MIGINRDTKWQAFASCVMLRSEKVCKTEQSFLNDFILAQYGKSNAASLKTYSH